VKLQQELSDASRMVYKVQEDLKKTKIVRPKPINSGKHLVDATSYLSQGQLGKGNRIVTGQDIPEDE
jgi:hypothetical protein